MNQKEFAGLLTAMEWGYLACERHDNLDKAKLDFIKLINKRWFENGFYKTKMEVNPEACLNL